MVDLLNDIDIEPAASRLRDLLRHREELRGEIKYIDAKVESILQRLRE